jgi:hypothetical protein
MVVYPRQAGDVTHVALQSEKGVHWHATRARETMIPKMNMVLNHDCDSQGYTEGTGGNFHPEWRQDGTKHGGEVRATSHSWEVARFLSQALEKRILKLAYLLPRAALL